MNFVNKEVLKQIKAKYPVGTKIKLNSMNDLQAHASGMIGTVTGIDDAGSLLMRWETGSWLNLICEHSGKFVDDFTILVE